MLLQPAQVPNAGLVRENIAGKIDNEGTIRKCRIGGSHLWYVSTPVSEHLHTGSRFAGLAAGKAFRYDVVLAENWQSRGCGIVHYLVVVARKVGLGMAECRVVESRGRSFGLDHV